MIEEIDRIIDGWDDVTVSHLRATSKVIHDESDGRWAHTSLNVRITSDEWRTRLKNAFRKVGS